MKFKNFTSRFFFVFLLLSSISNFAAAQFLGPVAICRNYTASITPNGVAVVSAQNINNGSYGYNNKYMIYNGAATNAITFTCNIVGQSFNVVLYVEDSLQVDTCTAVVTVTAMAGACNGSSGTVFFNNPVNASNCNTCNGQLSVNSVGSSGTIIPGPYTYLWSNGATTASITASTSGNYSVRVGNSNGCSNTSAATAVIVNPKPAITLSAFPFTRLYPGLNTTLTANSTAPVTYSWFRNGNVLAAATGSTLPVNIDQLGNYSVRVTNAAGCSNISALLSIADSASAQLFIYPNPNNGIFQVAYYNAGASKQTITVHDAKGARVYTKTFDINTPYQRMNINVRNHGKGTFIVTLSNANNQVIISEKVLVL